MIEEDDDEQEEVEEASKGAVFGLEALVSGVTGRASHCGWKAIVKDGGIGQGDALFEAAKVGEWGHRNLNQFLFACLSDSVPEPKARDLQPPSLQLWPLRPTLPVSSPVPPTLVCRNFDSTRLILYFSSPLLFFFCLFQFCLSL